LSCYMRYELVDFGGEWADKCNKRVMWASKQVKKNELTKKLLRLQEFHHDFQRPTRTKFKRRWKSPKTSMILTKY
ncbi:6068_t:CDS:1, partial [Funneliformis mosseae]